MPRLKPDTHRARLEHILDAAELCFARSGFHATSMHDICRAAGVSPGALYGYFASKEALIAGIAERDRLKFQDRFAELASAPDFFSALEQIGDAYFIEDEPHRRLMCVEIGLESTRSPQVGAIHRSVDDYVRESFETLFGRMVAEGRIKPQMDVPSLARVFMVLGDGLFWRSAVDPRFDIAKTLPDIVGVVRQLLQPIDDKPEHRASEPRQQEAAQ